MATLSIQNDCITIVLRTVAFRKFVCFIIQVLKVEENTFSYYAELEILDSTICKAKAMKINFQPVKCPTQVRIHFDGAKE